MNIMNYDYYIFIYIIITPPFIHMLKYLHHQNFTFYSKSRKYVSFFSVFPTNNTILIFCSVMIPHVDEDDFWYRQMINPINSTYSETNTILSSLYS